MTSHFARGSGFLLVTITCLWTGPTAQADILHVPGQYPNIQAAIDVAVDGDIVEIADGTYTGDGNRNLNVGGKIITVRSAAGDPTRCIIDCESSGYGFLFENGEAADTIVEGLTVRNGIGYDVGDGYRRGGAVYCIGSSPTFTDCVFSENAPNDLGGAIVCWDGSHPRLIRCTMTGNTASFGGAIFCWNDSNPTIAACSISGNVAHEGGGIGCSRSSPTITGCTISRNTADLHFTAGGGIGCWNDSNPTIADCTISENASGRHGGGIACFQSSPVLLNCRVRANSAEIGGGLHFWYCENPTLANCTISDNTAKRGAGLSCPSGNDAILTNCTIRGNIARKQGGGIDCGNGSPTLTNCILWSNTPQEIASGTGNPVVTYCNVEGGWTGDGNIDVDPHFALPDDLHLMPDSPCVDAGTNAPPGGLPGADQDGNERPLDGDGDAVAIADMGVYEFNGSVPTIATSPAGFTLFAAEGADNPPAGVLSIRNAGGGTLEWEITASPAWLTISPPTGHSHGEVNEVTLTADAGGLSHGMYSAELAVADPPAANSPRTVVVTLNVTTTLNVPGDYPTIQSAIDAATVNGDVVQVANGTYNGEGNKDLDVGGKAIAVRSESGDPSLCTIDCEGDGRGFVFDSREGPDTCIEGLTITNGNVGGPGGRDSGGGIYFYFASPTINSCRITGCTADFGGGLACEVRGPTLGDCTVHGNMARFAGGGVWCEYHGHATFINCTMSRNTAQNNGGGAGCYDADATFINCLINDNTADQSGGGLYVFLDSEPTLISCTIAGNSTGRDSAGVHIDDSDTTIKNSILWDNSPRAIFAEAGSTPVVTWCNVERGWPGEGNIDADPLFAAGPGGCFYVSQTAAGQPFDSPCVDAGSDTAANLGLDALTTRRDEVTDSGTVDMGYHYPITGEPYLPGDINGDGVRDLLDYAEFGSAMTGPGPLPPGTVSGCLTAADLDDDGDIDAADFAPLQLLLGQPPFTN